jgi:predicted RND superfamily exporter protein
MALHSIIVRLGIAALLARKFSLSVFIVNMMTGMGLALGIDYSLFMISRFREERGHGRGKEAPRDQHSRESPPAKKAGEGTTTPPRSPRTDLADRRVRSGQE